MTQNEIILKHLQEFGSITPLEALQEYGIMRLASRISDLKRNGTNISGKIIKSRNRRGETVHYAEYTLHNTNDTTEHK